MIRRVKNSIRNELLETRLKPFSSLLVPIYSGIGSILMFHRVIPDDVELRCEDLEIKVSYLEKTIRYFRHHNYEFVSLDQAYERIANPEKNKRKFVAFTFDDGYLDNLTVAYPVFKKHHVPFTIYVTTSFPDRTADIWWYALKDLVEQSSSINLNLKGGSFKFPAHTQEEKRVAYNSIREMAVNTEREDLPEFLNMLFADSGIELSDYVEKMALNWDQVRFLSKEKLVTIGAHTKNHLNLKQLSKLELQNEVKESKKSIERVIDKEVLHFAYPFGSKNEASTREFQVLKDLGFKTCTTTRCANVFSKHSHHTMSLPRITLSPYIGTPHHQYYIDGLIPAIDNKLKRIVTD